MLLQAKCILELKTNPNKKHTPQPTYPTVACVLPKCSEKQKLSTTRCWETEFADMSRSIHTAVCFVNTKCIVFLFKNVSTSSYFIQI